MKQNITLLFLLLFSVGVNAQCDELFISEYVESGWNNRALEIYNPTSEAVDLSQYLIHRFSNGTANVDGSYTLPLPEVSLEPYSTFVVVTDKRDTLGTCLEQWLFDGFLQLEVRLDSMGNEILDSLGNPQMQLLIDDVTCSDGSQQPGPVRGTTYHEEYDLKGKANFFAAPVYNDNSSMYWNGNDAVCLVKGTSVAVDYHNVVDVVGVIGENPGEFWANDNGQRMTQNSTLLRGSSALGGTVQVADNGDSFNSGDWWWRSKYTFENLGSHECDCENLNSINRIVGNANVQMYPNPVNGEFFNVKAEEAIQSVSFQTLDGKTMKQVEYNSSETKVQINLNDLVPNFYLVKVNLENGSQVAGKVMVK